MTQLITIPIAQPVPTIRILRPAGAPVASLTPRPVSDPQVQALCHLVADILQRRDRISELPSQIAETN